MTWHGPSLAVPDSSSSFPSSSPLCMEYLSLTISVLHIKYSCVWPCQARQLQPILSFIFACFISCLTVWRRAVPAVLLFVLLVLWFSSFSFAVLAYLRWLPHVSIQTSALCPTTDICLCLASDDRHTSCYCRPFNAIANCSPLHSAFGLPVFILLGSWPLVLKLLELTTLDLTPMLHYHGASKSTSHILWRPSHDLLVATCP